MATDLYSAMGFVRLNDTPASGNLMCRSIDAGITATGTVFSTAAPLVSEFNILGTVAASSGVSLPVQTAPGATVVVLNNTATAATVYPPLGGIINGGSVNAGIALAAASGGVAGKLAFMQTAALTYLQS